MKRSIKAIIATIFASMSIGTAIGIGGFSNANDDAKVTKAANNNWESLVVYYAASSTINGRISVNRGGVPGDQWENENMSYTNRKCGSNFVYTATVWEYYGGFDDIYFKDGDSVLHHISGWTGRDTMSGKMYDGSTWNTIYTVDFNANGHGTAPAGQYAISGGKVTKPSDPSAAGYTFGGWYKEAGCKNVWNFNTDTVTANKTLYAKWTPVNHTITKKAVYDGVVQAGNIGTDSVLDGSTYAVPSGVFISNYSFGGWYTDAGCNTAYTSRTISSDLTIYGKYNYHGAWSGTINVDLRDSSWSEADAKYAVMFMDKETYPEEHDDWSSIVSASAGQKLVQIPYNIGFSPLQMLIVRYNPAKTDYDTDKWSYRWGQTYDDIFGIYARIGAYNEGDEKNVVYVGAPKIIGGNGSWSNIKFFDNVKLNGYNNAEYYTTVTLAANVEFKVQVAPYADGDYYANYTTHSSIASNFSGGGDSNIRVVTAGTYAIYFDYFGTYDNSARIYITTEAAAAADEWAQYFLNNVGCDATGVNPPSGWSDCATEYAKLSGDAKHIVYSATADEGGNYVEKAVARYDQALRSHPSLTKFIVDSDGTTQRTPHVAFNPIAIVSSKNTNGTIIIVVISVITVGAVAGYFFLRRRKED